MKHQKNQKNRKARPACPTPHKAAYKDHKHAIEGLRSTQRAGFRGLVINGKTRRAELRAYPCPCGRFHLSSKPERNQGNFELAS